MLGCYWSFSKFTLLPCLINCNIVYYWYPSRTLFARLIRPTKYRSFVCLTVMSLGVILLILVSLVNLTIRWGGRVMYMEFSLLLIPLFLGCRVTYHSLGLTQATLSLDLIVLTIPIGIFRSLLVRSDWGLNFLLHGEYRWVYDLRYRSGCFIALVFLRLITFRLIPLYALGFISM